MVVTVSHQQVGGFAVVVLPEADFIALGQPNQMLPTSFIQFTVGRIGDGFFLLGAIDGHRLKILGLQGLASYACLDHQQHPFATFFADAVSPLGERGRVAGHLMLKELLATKILPVRIFHPARHTS